MMSLVSTMTKKQRYKNIADIGDYVVCHSLDFDDTYIDFITFGNSYKVLDVFTTNNIDNRKQYFLYKIANAQLLDSDGIQTIYNSKLFKSMIDCRESKLDKLLQ